MAYDKITNYEKDFLEGSFGCQIYSWIIIGNLQNWLTVNAEIDLNPSLVWLKDVKGYVLVQRNILSELFNRTKIYTENFKADDTFNENIKYDGTVVKKKITLPFCVPAL